MAALIFDIHPETPQKFKITKVATDIRNGAVVLYPCDTGFALGCDISNRDAINRVRDIRRLPLSKPLTFLCDSLTNVSEFARVSNAAYKTIKSLIPGPYTFILPASKSTPRYAQNPKRKSAGIRVPDSRLTKALLGELNHPIISISAKLGDTEISDNDELVTALHPLVDVVITSQTYDFKGKSTVIDMTSDEFSIIREGAGMDKLSDYVEVEEIA